MMNSWYSFNRLAWLLAALVSNGGYFGSALPASEIHRQDLCDVGYTADRVQDSPETPPMLGTGQADPNKKNSKELPKQNGLLVPPSEGDPEIRRPVPESFESDMPVIPPPAMGNDLSPDEK